MNQKISNANRKNKEKDLQIERFKKDKEDLEAKHKEEMERLRKQFHTKISGLLTEE